MNTETSPWHGLRTSLLVLAVNLIAACALVAILTLAVATAAHAAGDANQETCEAFGQTESSPGFRAFLLDCRAFELVTPEYMDGQVALGAPKEYAPPVSVDGDHLLGKALAAFAGTEGEEQDGFETGAWYEFSRSSAGWSPEALNPPSSQYPRATLLLAGSDLSQTLWELDPAAMPGEEVPEITPAETNKFVFAVREPAGGGKGRFVVLGPKSAPGRVTPAFQGSTQVVAASGDVGNVFFNVFSGYKQLWPGDRTREGDESLYEYRRGQGSEPILVGVMNEGPLSGSSHINEGAELASECGIGFGTPGVSMFNAVSASGETVVFSTDPCSTSQVPELYARINAEKTVSISEPSLSVPGRECTGTCLEDEEDPAKRSAGTFQGASEDGSKIFFTTKQPLVNAAIGGVSHPYLYEETLAGKGMETRVASLTLISPEVPAIARISEDGSRVYFESTSVLTGAANGVGEAAQEGAYNLYVYDTETGTPAFVADLLTQHEAGGLSIEEIEARTLITAADKSRPFDTTQTGEYLVFPSVRHLTGSEDTSAVSQLFEYDAATGGLARVSIGARSAAGYECPETGTLLEGYGCNGNTSSGEDTPLMVKTYDFTSSFQPTTASSQLSVAGDGMVVFESKDRLAPQAVAGGENVYEYRAGEVYVVSPGSEDVLVAPVGGLSRLMETDPSGENIYFTSTENLVPQDTDSQQSWYDARTGGGFAAPPQASGCAGDTCQGPLPASPTSASPLATPGANENFVPTPLAPSKAKPKKRASRTLKCPKGKTLSHGKCTKAKSKARKATTNRRQSR